RRRGAGVLPNGQAGGGEAALRFQGEHGRADRPRHRRPGRTRLRAGFRAGAPGAGGAVGTLDRCFDCGLSRAMAPAYGPLGRDGPERGRGGDDGAARNRPALERTAMSEHHADITERAADVIVQAGWRRQILFWLGAVVTLVLFLYVFSAV